MTKRSSITFDYHRSFGLVIAYWILELIYRLFLNLGWHFFQFNDSDADDEYIYVILQNISDFRQSILRHSILNSKCCNHLHCSK